MKRGGQEFLFSILGVFFAIASIIFLLGAVTGILALIIAISAMINLGGFPLFFPGTSKA